MARGVAKTPEERIADIESKKAEFQVKIDNYRGKIAELDHQIKELKEEQKKVQLDELLQAIQASGKTVDEVLSAVSGSPQ
ncbi:MAG: cortexillin II [Ethanoligenens sp.]